MPVVCTLCFLSVCLVSYYQVITFQRAEEHEETRIKSLMYATGGQAFPCTQSLEDGEDQQYPVRSCRKHFGERIDLVRFSCAAL